MGIGAVMTAAALLRLAVCLVCVESEKRLCFKMHGTIEW